MLGIPALDSLFVPAMTIEASGGVIDLTQYYEDVSMSGMSSEYQDFVSSFDKDNCYFHFKAFGNVTMLGKFKITGRLLLFQLNGHGNANTTLVNLVSWHNATCAFYEKGGLEYINITNWLDDYQPGKVLYDFDNLIDGNVELSAQVLQVINDNNLEVFESVRRGYEKSYGSIYHHLANNIFSRIPWREIFLD